MDLRDYNQRNVDERLGRLQTDIGSLQADVAVLETDVAVIKASMATKGDVIQLQRAMFALILPIYGVLILILIFLYNAKI